MVDQPDYAKVIAPDLTSEQIRNAWNGVDKTPEVLADYIGATWHDATAELPPPDVRCLVWTGSTYQIAHHRWGKAWVVGPQPRHSYRTTDVVLWCALPDPPAGAGGALTWDRRPRCGNLTGDDGCNGPNPPRCGRPQGHPIGCGPYRPGDRDLPRHVQPRKPLTLGPGCDRK